MATTIDLSLTGCVNGVPVNLTGQAVLDGSSVEIDVTTRAAPLHWDPVLGVLGFLDAVYILALVEAGRLGPIEVAFMSRKTQLRDEHSRVPAKEVIHGSELRGRRALPPPSSRAKRRGVRASRCAIHNHY